VPHKYHCACIYLHSRRVCCEESGPLECCTVSIFQLPPTFRQKILSLLLGSSIRGRGLFDPEYEGTTVVWNVREYVPVDRTT